MSYTKQDALNAVAESGVSDATWRRWAREFGDSNLESDIAAEVTERVGKAPTTIVKVANGAAKACKCSDVFTQRHSPPGCGEWYTYGYCTQCGIAWYCAWQEM